MVEEKKRQKEAVPNQALRKEREDRGWTQAYVAERLGLSDSHTIGRWERGVIYPGPFWQQKLCDLYQKNKEELGFFTKRALHQNIPEQDNAASHSRTSSNTNRERMLRRLRRSYRDLLAQFLQGMAWMEMGLTERPDAVQNMTNLTLRIAKLAERPLPPGISITQVYEEAEEELLILGEPGAGKSTLLLHLAQHLVIQAEADEQCLLPVLLPLSSWAVKQAELSDWMVEQIAQTYDIPRKVSQQWVQDEQILPLLDGLDEMEEAARPACIAAINAYHRAHLTALVVCSRITEYESAASEQRLALQSSVVVRPLTSEQVETALDQAGEKVAELRTALHEQPALHELATTPLMLSVLMLAYQETSVPTGSLNEMALELQIWSDYIQRMVERKHKGHGRQYELSPTRKWLGWLAQQMRQHNQTIFYLERLQPNWLPKKLGIRYRLSLMVVVALVVALVFGLVSRLDFGLVVGLPFRLDFGLFVKLDFGLAVGPICVLAVRLLSLLVFNDIKPTETLIWSPKSVRSGLVFRLVVGLVVGPIFVLAVRLLSEPVVRLFIGLVVGLVVGPIVGLHDGIAGKQLPERLMLSPNEGIRRSRKSGLFVGLVSGLVCGLVSGLIVGLIVGLVCGLFVGLVIGLIVGLVSGLSRGLDAVLQHYILRFWLARSSTFPWQAIPFLEDATARILLRRVGGGYSFVHRRLLDHFADAYPSTIKEGDKSLLGRDGERGLFLGI